MSAFALKHFLNVSTDGDIADELGNLRAAAKEIADQMKFLEGLLKHKRVELAEGKKFRVKIAYDIETTRVDWKSAAVALGADESFLAQFEKVALSDRVQVTAHPKVPSKA
jgi:hypothetical protein